MWPPPSQLVESTLAAETAVEDLYAEALRLWAPKAAAAMLPTLDTTTVTAAAAELPPDPDAITSTQSDWDELMAGIVLPGVAQIWMDAAAAAVAAGAIGATVELGGTVLASALDQFITAYSLLGAKVPVLVRDGMRSLMDTAMTSVEPPSTGGLRRMLRNAIAPGSAFMRKTARTLGFHGASILNDALMTIASYGHADRKLWLCVHPDTIVYSDQVINAARRPYSGLMVTVRTSDDSCAFTVTPEHKVLTADRGWIRADDLNQRDHLIKVDWGHSVISPHVENEPASIAKILDPLFELRPTDEMRAVRTGMDFHVEDISAGQVEVVLADSQLRNYFDPGGAYCSHQVEFILPDAAAFALFTERDSGLSGNCQRPSFGESGTLGNPGMLMFCSLAVGANDASLRSVPDVGAVLTQDPCDCRRGTADMSGDAQLGHTGLVQLVDVIDVDIHAFSGYVYDLQTSTEWFTANSIIVHNSRRDTRVRETHRIADGQVVPLAGSFTVGGTELSFPGDPRGPAREVMNCRCRMIALAPGEFGPAPWVDESAPIAASAASEENTMTDTVLDAAEAFDRGVITAEQAAGPELYRTFTDAVIAFIGVPTSDNRMFSKDVAFDIRNPPLPLMWMRHTGEGGHSNAFSVGIIEEAHLDDGKVLASGYLLNTPEADEAVEQLKHGITRPSVDLGRNQWSITDQNGVELSEEQWWDLPLNARVYTTFSEAELIAMTLVATPAFGDTKLTLNAERESRDVGIIAAAQVCTRVYPAAHFADPQLCGQTLPTIDEDGRVYGHIACWDQPHRSVGLRNIKPPHSPSGYEHFHTSPAVCLDDDTCLPVGRLTVATGHAPGDLSGIPAQAHYDNTGTCWALVRCGEDAHGIWFSGVVAPWASPEQIEAGLCSPLSGDWRDFGQGLELVAALSVNTPGFMVRGRSDEQGRPVALVAALGPTPDEQRWQLTREDVKAAVAEALAEASFTAERDRVLAASLALTRPKTPNEQISEMLAKAGL